MPDPETEELMYQTLLGAWPFDTGKLPEFKKRFKDYMLKAAREMRNFTSWIRPDAAYEKALQSFIDAVMTEFDGNVFLEDFLLFQKEIAFYGAVNSLGQVLLKITAPGVPDFYQVWNSGISVLWTRTTAALWISGYAGGC